MAEAGADDRNETLREALKEVRASTAMRRIIVTVPPGDWECEWVCLDGRAGPNGDTHRSHRNGEAEVILLHDQFGDESVFALCLGPLVRAGYHVRSLRLPAVVSSYAKFSVALEALLRTLEQSNEDTTSRSARVSTDVELRDIGERALLRPGRHKVRCVRPHRFHFVAAGLSAALLLYFTRSHSYRIRSVCLCDGFLPFTRPSFYSRSAPWYLRAAPAFHLRGLLTDWLTDLVDAVGRRESIESIATAATADTDVVDSDAVELQEAPLDPPPPDRNTVVMNAMPRADRGGDEQARLYVAEDILPQLSPEELLSRLFLCQAKDKDGIDDSDDPQLPGKGDVPASGRVHKKRAVVYPISPRVISFIDSSALQHAPERRALRGTFPDSFLYPVESECLFPYLSPQSAAVFVAHLTSHFSRVAHSEATFRDRLRREQAADGSAAALDDSAPVEEEEHTHGENGADSDDDGGYDNQDDPSLGSTLVDTTASLPPDALKPSPDPMTAVVQQLAHV